MSYDFLAALPPDIRAELEEEARVLAEFDRKKREREAALLASGALPATDTPQMESILKRGPGAPPTIEREVPPMEQIKAYLADSTLGQFSRGIGGVANELAAQPEGEPNFFDHLRVGVSGAALPFTAVPRAIASLTEGMNPRATIDAAMEQDILGDVGSDTPSRDAAMAAASNALKRTVAEIPSFFGVPESGVQKLATAAVASKPGQALIAAGARSPFVQRAANTFARASIGSLEGGLTNVGVEAERGTPVESFVRGAGPAGALGAIFGVAGVGKITDEVFNPAPKTPFAKPKVVDLAADTAAQKAAAEALEREAADAVADVANVKLATGVPDTSVSAPVATQFSRVPQESVVEALTGSVENATRAAALLDDSVLPMLNAPGLPDWGGPGFMSRVELQSVLDDLTNVRSAEDIPKVLQGVDGPKLANTLEATAEAAEQFDPPVPKDLSDGERIAQLGYEVGTNRWNATGIAQGIRNLWEIASSGQIRSGGSLIDALSADYVSPSRVNTLAREAIGGEAAALRAQFGPLYRDLSSQIGAYAKQTGQSADSVRETLYRARVTGKPDLVPDELRQSFDAATAEIDKLSTEIAGAIGETRLGKHIGDNVGQYLFRGYDAFSIPTSKRRELFTKPSGVYFAQVLKDAMPEKSDEEILGLMFQMVASGEGVDHAIKRVFGIVPQQLKKRANLNEPARAFLAETKDIIKASSSTVNGLTSMVATHRVFSQMRDRLVSAGRAVEGPYLDWQPITAKFGELPNPFGDLRVEPTAAAALNAVAEQTVQLKKIGEVLASTASAFEAKPLEMAKRGLKGFAGYTKLGLVVGNPGSWWNSTAGSALSYAAASGITGAKTFATHLGDAIRITAASVTEGTNASDVLRDTLSRRFRERYPAQNMDKVFMDMVREGIIGGGAIVGELESAIGFAGAVSPNKIANSKLGRAAGTAADITKRGFAATDNFWRVLRVFDEFDKQMRSAGPSPGAAEEAWQKAFAIAKDTMPTTSRTPKAAKWISENPVFGPFFTIRAELVRNTINTAIIATKEVAEGIQTGNVQKMRNGAERIVGLGGVAYAYTQLVDMMFASENTTEEQRNMIAKLVERDYEAGSELVVGEFRPGESVEVRNPSRYLPTEFVSQVVAVASDSSFGSWANLIGLEPGAKALAEVVAGGSIYGFNETLQEGLRSGRPVVSNLNPDWLNTFLRTANATKTLAPSWVDSKIEMLMDAAAGAADVKTSFAKKRGGPRSIPDAAVQRAREIADVWKPDIEEYRTRSKVADPAMKANDMARLSRVWSERATDASERVRQMRAAMMTDAEIVKALRDGGFTVKAATALSNGELPSVFDVYDSETGEARRK